MNILNELKEIDLNAENSVVIGSGILSAYGIRDSNDIDVVTDIENYDRLAADVRFLKVNNHGREVIIRDKFEIGTSWGVLGRDQTIDDIKEKSTVVEGVRYITIEFLLAVKKSWLQDDGVRQKDIDDVELIEKYLAQ